VKTLTIVRSPGAIALGAFFAGVAGYGRYTHHPACYKFGGMHLGIRAQRAAAAGIEGGDRDAGRFSTSTLVLPTSRLPFRQRRRVRQFRVREIPVREFRQFRQNS
jgi:hypothetical protein